ncbi:HlyD family efflux transporter periplasmic adaptor subunit [Dyadobacter flavalbus]|uniref:HlyD family efflux transporter periplasmic adaptor subunit n=1 Tax=Dyadobacter flavalbus TaxID=2579942 RepID=A0A5M8QVS3_9BACT|nr:HlyD family efflux transporter periplasmic adaptor subunit [Dyadobacter flavalbus]KAA6438904.1 HlyD family efflux transporter periplasmic adaptor subunit [Dyadobacter flavalbus]
MAELMEYHQPNDEIQEIIGQVPSGVVRWGITFSLILLLTVLWVSRYLYLPVAIKATAILNAKEQYFKVVWMKTDPAVDYLVKVSENQSVRKSDTLLVEANSQTGKKKYYTSPTDGKVAIFKGTEQMPRASVLMVVPAFSDYTVELKVPVSGAGQLRKGQKVILRLDEFPESKYGFLIGKVATTTLIPIDKFYRIKVDLSNGMTTNIDQHIPLQASISGTAEIITENTSVFDKIFKYLI